jgi:predicted ATPase
VRRERGFLLSTRIERDPEVPDDYASGLPAVSGLDGFRFDPAVTFLVGANGSGKSTVLEAVAIAAGLNPEGGSRNFNFASRPSHSTFLRHLVLTWAASPRTDFFLRAESFYNVASAVEEVGDLRYYGGISLHDQSHGESFLALVVNRFSPDGLYFLDEPEAALSPHGQLALLRAIHDRVADGCQFVIANHSPILIAYPHAAIHECGPHGIRPVSYDNAPQVELYRSFLDAPDQFLRHLLSDEDEDGE